MIGRLWPVFVRDLTLLSRGAQGRGGAVLPLLFFLAVAMLFPFAVGPDARLLARTGAGVIWVAALLAAILPLDRLVEPDLEAGFFDQWALRGFSEEALLLSRILAHWISFGIPLMIAAPLSAGLLSLDAGQLLTVEIGLLLGTPGLAAIGVDQGHATDPRRGHDRDHRIDPLVQHCARMGEFVAAGPGIALRFQLGLQLQHALGRLARLFILVHASVPASRGG